jgi:Uma2 family endonuclease
MSAEAYLQMEEASEPRHEFVNGEVYARSGGSPRHAALGSNLNALLFVATSQGRCRPTSPDQRLFVEITGAFFYPDVQLICGPFQRAGSDAHSVVNPTAIFEVLSPSTAGHDHGAKFDHYRHIPTLQHYVLVDSVDTHVVHHRRVEEGWLRRDLVDGALRLDGLDGGGVVTLAVDDIYGRLDDVG